MIAIDQFKLSDRSAADLKNRPTKIKPVYDSKRDYTTLLEDQVNELGELQERLYASRRYAVLVIFQGMDASGKDGAIKHVMSGINPQGCEVTSFKQPSPEEQQHDFLWRTTRRLPEKGRIGIFNRSYYEEVLVPRVHPEVLAGEAIPDLPNDHSSIWKERFHSINHHERHLHANGTRIIKFFLHLSKEKQRKRFLKRIDDPVKNWKFGQTDMQERSHWDKYMEAYEDCLQATSTDDAPWYIVPADDKENSCLVISQVILENLRRLNLEYPSVSADRVHELHEFRRQLSD
jgi:PPK2 family polyphosphate:nucleotide phosphotransferase